MGRASRLKLVNKPAVKPASIPVDRPEFRSQPRLSPDVFFKRGIHEPRVVSEFWIWLSMEFSDLAWRYPNMSAQRALEGEHEGEWVIKGDPYGAQAFRDLAVLAARKIGYHGGPHGAVQMWLSHMHGDDIQRVKEPIMDPKTIDFLTVDEKGEKEFHLGRYKQSGVDWRSGSEDKEVNPKPMEPPKPLLPAINSKGPKGVQ